jgi:hypothetical protein
LFFAYLSMILRKRFNAFGWNNSSGVRGVLSSNTTSACHFEPKAVNCKTHRLLALYLNEQQLMQ